MEPGDNGDSSRPRPSTRSLSTRRKILFGTLSLAVFLAALEGAARVVAPLFLEDAFETSTARSTWAQEGWTVDPVLGWTMIKNDEYVRGGVLSVTNSHGLRGPEFPVEKAPGSLRVLTVGDSTVMGFGVGLDEVFSSRLQRILDQALDQPVEVVNAGVPGYSSEQARLYLETRGMALDPDVVIFQSNYNDRRAVAPGGESDSLDHFRSISRRLAIFEFANYSAAVQLLRRVVSNADLTLLRSGSYTFNEIRVDSPPRVSLARYEENVRAIVALARRGGARVILVGLPDNPALVGGITRALALMEAGDLWGAEKELRGSLSRPNYRLLAQKILNQVLERAGRVEEIRETVPAGILEKSTGGHSPVDAADLYVDVLRRLGEEIDVPIVIPEAPPGVEPRQIYIDQTHLNARGHEIVATELAHVLTGP